jgi:hypothetical protein
MSDRHRFTSLNLSGSTTHKSRSASPFFIRATKKQVARCCRERIGVIRIEPDRNLCGAPREHPDGPRLSMEGEQDEKENTIGGSHPGLVDPVGMRTAGAGG